ncbi:hypothetical protein, partial [Halorubrum ezzemoulense]|uniref:hypothetical protein n=1 Tax=Halorubrum ezzemoulense TaxID=337243 RepID=UPI00232FE31F
MVEQLSPETREPTSFDRRGGPGGEVEFWFNRSVSIIYVGSGCHTAQLTAPDRIGLQLNFITHLN